MPNTNTVTGIRYGVISARSLDPDVYDTLFYDGTNLSEEAALVEIRREVEARADAIEEECEVALRERDPNMGERDFEYLLEAEIEKAYDRTGYRDREDYVESEVDRFNMGVETDEPEIEGEYEGVKYRISWLGGAPLVWILEGPIGSARQLCSPCVPNAADLDSGFSPVSPNEEGADGVVDFPYECYVCPYDWLVDDAG